MQDALDLLAVLARHAQVCPLTPSFVYTLATSGPCAAGFFCPTGSENATHAACRESCDCNSK